VGRDVATIIRGGMDLPPTWILMMALATVALVALAAVLMARFVNQARLDSTGTASQSDVPSAFRFVIWPLEIKSYPRRVAMVYTHNILEVLLRYTLLPRASHMCMVFAQCETPLTCCVISMREVHDMPHWYSRQSRGGCSSTSEMRRQRCRPTVR